MSPEFCSGVARVVENNGLVYFYRYVERPAADGSNVMDHIAIPCVIMPVDGVIRALSLTIAVLKEHLGDGMNLPLGEWRPAS